MSKNLRKNSPEYKPRLQPSRHPQDTGTVERTDKEEFEEELADNALNELKGKVGEDPRTPPALANLKTTSETTGTVDLQNPAFDPDIPEQKQRNFR